MFQHRKLPAFLWLYLFGQVNKAGWLRRLTEDNQVIMAAILELRQIAHLTLTKLTQLLQESS
jgi:hypothetical protein